VRTHTKSRTDYTWPGNFIALEMGIGGHRDCTTVVVRLVNRTTNVRRAWINGEILHSIISLIIVHAIAFSRTRILFVRLNTGPSMTPYIQMVQILSRSKSKEFFSLFIKKNYSVCYTRECIRSVDHINILNYTQYIFINSCHNILYVYIFNKNNYYHVYNT